MDYVTIPTHIRTHVRYQGLPPSMFKVFIMLLTMAADEDRGGLLPGYMEIAADLALKPQEAAAAVEWLTNHDFLVRTDDGLRPKHWGRLFSVKKGTAPKKAAPPKVFIPPTAAEVSKYGLEQNFYLDGQKFIDYYEAKGWLVGKSPMKDWKAAVRNWKHLRAEQSVASAQKETKDW